MRSQSFEDEEEETEVRRPGEAVPNSDTKSHVRLEDLDHAAQKNRTQEAHSAPPLMGGLAALKVKNRLQALHQDAKKKLLPGLAPASADLSVKNAVHDKPPEVLLPAVPKQEQSANSMSSMVTAARTTLPKFASGPAAAEEEAEIKSLLGEVEKDKDLQNLLSEVGRIMKWLFDDTDTDFDNCISYSQLKAIFQRPSAPLGSNLAFEVDACTTAADKEDLCNRMRFLEIFILLAIRVNQSPILTSRLQDAKRDMARGFAFAKRGSGSGNMLAGSSGDLEQSDLASNPKVALLAGIPRMPTQTDQPQQDKWQSAVRRMSAVMLATGRRQSQQQEAPEPEALSPMSKMEKVFATHR